MKRRHGVARATIGVALLLCCFVATHALSTPGGVSGSNSEVADAGLGVSPTPAPENAAITTAKPTLSSLLKRLAVALIVLGASALFWERRKR
jgi:hypothetical protein